MRSQRICSTQSTAVSRARTEEEKEKAMKLRSDSTFLDWIFLNYIVELHRLHFPLGMHADSDYEIAPCLRK